MEPFILESKLRPPANSRLIRRDRLLVDIRDQDHERLTVITADAGYGKTTLMAQIFEAAGEGAIWYQFDELDNSASLFMEHLTWAIAKPFPDIAKILREALTGMEAQNETRKLTWMSSLVNNIDGSDSRRMSLFLDDFHMINDNDEILELIRFMAAHLSADCRFVIGSRDRPDISLGRQRAQGQVHDIITADLVFSESESRRLFNELCPFELSDKAVRAWHEATEGWPIAMVMAAAVMDKDKCDTRSIIPSLVLSSGSLGEFLAEEIWKSVRISMKQILMEASLLYEVDTEVLDMANVEREALLPANGFFQEAVERHILTMCLINNYRYRFHSIFKQFLLSKLQSTYSPDQIATLHGRYAGAYVEKNEIEQALNHYIAAGFMDEAAALLERHGDSILEAGKVDTIHQWLKRIPESVKDKTPALYLLESRTLKNQGELEKGMERLDRAQHLMEKKGDRNKLFQCEFTRSNFMLAVERYEDSLKSAAAAESLAESEEQQVEAKSRAATLTLLLGDARKAMEKLDEAEGSFHDSTGQLARHIAVQRLAANFFAGDFKRMLNDTEKLYVIDKPPDQLRERFVVVFMRARVLFNTCRYDQSLEVVEKARTFIGEEYGTVHRHSLDLIRGENYLYTGRSKQGIRIIRKYARPDGARKPYGQDSEHTYLGAYYRRLGEYDKAEYFDRQAVTDHKDSNRLLAITHANLSMGATLLRLKGPDDSEALEFLAMAQIQATDSGYQYILSQVHFCRAWAALQKEDRPAALKEISLCLDGAARYWHNHFIVQEGRICLDLLVFAYERDIQRDYLLDIFSIIGQEATIVLTPLLESDDPPVRESAIQATIAAGGIQAAPLIHRLLRDRDRRVKEVAHKAMNRLRDEIGHPDEVLTDRESEVLAYVAEGISNAEIAERLYISEPTIKTHLTRIFQKLGVTKRTQAAAFYHKRTARQD